VSNILKILLVIVLTTSCSLNKSDKFWSKEEVTQAKQVETKEIFKKKETLNLEFNPSLKIKLYSKLINNSFLNNLDNNNGRINYNGDLQSISRYKFKKIENLHQYEPEIIFNKDNIIFFDSKGSILNFDKDSNLIWKKNYYSKTEKKQQPVLFFAKKNNILIVADNIAKFYALDINTGELLWTKENTAPFNSQIKIYKDKFFVIDFENTLRAHLIKDGTQVFDIKTQDSLIRSQKKLSMVIVKETIYFNNSLGDISAVDINSGELIWQSPTQSNLVYDSGFFLKTSDIVANDGKLFFSNNQNQFFSLDMQTGSLNWKQKINSSLRSTIINNYIFCVTLEGYLAVIEKNTGNIIRVTDIFQQFKSKKRIKIKPTGFIIGEENIYISTSNGRLLEVDINSGKTKYTLKINSKTVSRAAVVNKNLYIISESSIIKLN